MQMNVAAFTCFWFLMFGVLDRVYSHVCAVLNVSPCSLLYCLTKNWCMLVGGFAWKTGAFCRHADVSVTASLYSCTH